MAIIAVTPSVTAQSPSSIEHLPLFEYQEAIDPLEARVDDLLYHLTNAEKVAQLIMVYYAGEAFVTEHQFGSVLVMQNMLKDPDAIRVALKRVQQNSRVGVFVAIDQEGGVVNRIKRLPGWNKIPSAKIMREWDAGKITELTSRVGAVLADTP